MFTKKNPAKKVKEKSISVKSLNALLSKLSKSEREDLFHELKNKVLGDISQAKEVKTCPCCESTQFVKRGFYNGVQKYICKNTQKIFTYRSKLIVARIRKLDKLTQLLDLMISQRRFLTLREIVDRLQVSNDSAFKWRSQILTAIYEDINFNGHVIEFDEMNFMISRKGRRGMGYRRFRGLKKKGDNGYNVKVFMVYSRITKRLELRVSHMGRTDVQDMANYFDSKKGFTTYCDKHQTYGKYFKGRGLEYKVFRASDRVSKEDRSVHNQALNYYTGVIEDFINCDLHGVSTKYLQGYLNWIQFVENFKRRKDILPKQVISKNRVALDIFKQKEKEFQYFLKNNGRTNYGHCKERYKLSA